MKYLVSNSYGIGDALNWLNAIILFEKEKDRNITITFHQREGDKKIFSFTDIKQIYSFFCLKPTDTVCIIDHCISTLEPDDIGEENFKIEGFKDFYFDIVNRHYFEIDIEPCENREGTSAMFYESGKIFQPAYEGKSITADQYQKIKDKLDPIELHQWDGEKRTTNMFFTTMKNPYLIPANLKMINESAKFVGSEGLWSHYSRALGVETHCINKQGRYLSNIEREFDVIAEIFKKQGHYLYSSFMDLYKNV
mgnify:CR=1 FL=1|tara:strand:- start:104 stop:856 length:753 start_codon:yes stop_codon:yes gene_type:complete